MKNVLCMQKQKASLLFLRMILHDLTWNRKTVVLDVNIQMNYVEFENSKNVLLVISRQF